MLFIPVIWLSPHNTLSREAGEYPIWQKGALHGKITCSKSRSRVPKVLPPGSVFFSCSLLWGGGEARPVQTVISPLATPLHPPSQWASVLCSWLLRNICHSVPHLCTLVHTADLSPSPTVLFTFSYSPRCRQNRESLQGLFLHKYEHVTFLPRFLRRLLKRKSRVWSGPQKCYWALKCCCLPPHEFCAL